MKISTSLLLWLGLALSLVSLVSASPKTTKKPAPCKCTTTKTDDYMFKATLPNFLKQRTAKNPKCCDWQSDKCSHAPENPLGFDFAPACLRHDFGYRNMKKQKRFTDALKKKVDDVFKKDLEGLCAKEKNLESKLVCDGLAWVYYFAVREFSDL